jgi:uncharacterized protein YyaL (SSP411 family)
LVVWLLLLTLGVVGGCKSSEREKPAPAQEPTAVHAPADPRLPGLGEGQPELQGELDQAYAAKGFDYRPRTHHLDGSGKAKYVNRLILESSPYLLQHAHNPVNWWPWSKAAFARAKAEKKPVLLSVGYSTCHWCHVMERESFEDLEIATYINQNFVAIKVDREQRPDIDGIYMSAVRLMSGRGGWPMTVVMTPDKDPFFGGTYFPARDGDRGSRKGFLTILKELVAEYAADSPDLLARAQQISQRVQGMHASVNAGPLPDVSLLQRAVDDLRRGFDPRWGGFGRAPKFPRPVNLELLLRVYRRTGDAQLLEMVTHTLEQMARGGMYDQIGGGFHRYSVDERWLVPHFEKMLYDNAQLVPVYLAAYQLSNKPELARVARETLDYVLREMTDASGPFYSATDADSKTPNGHQEEGYFFTWTEEELRRALSPPELRLVTALFGVTSSGNFEGRNILFRGEPNEQVAKKLKLSLVEFERLWSEARRKLLVTRAKRPAPHLDDKVLTSWNGLMLSALAKGAIVLNEASYADAAKRAARRLLQLHVDHAGRLLRSSRAGRAGHLGYLDDYAFFIQGLLDLHEATSDVGWLKHALALQRVLDEHYADRSGGYYLTANDAEDLLVRSKPSYDGAEPAGNSVAIMNLLRLGEITLKQEFTKRGVAALQSFGATLWQAPQSLPKMLCAAEYYLDEPIEVLIVSPDQAADASELLGVVRDTYLPNRLFSHVAEGEVDAYAPLIPALEQKRARDNTSTAYVCRRGACKLPTSDARVLAKQLAEVHPLN